MKTMILIIAISIAQLTALSVSAQSLYSDSYGNTTGLGTNLYSDGYGNTSGTVGSESYNTYNIVTATRMEQSATVASTPIQMDTAIRPEPLVEKAYTSTQMTMATRRGRLVGAA